MAGVTGQTDAISIDKFEEDHAENFRQIVRAPLTSLNDIKTEELRQFAEWWGSGAQSPPSKKAFDILDHLKLAAHFYVIKRINDQTYDYILNGEEVVRLVGRSQAGTRFSEESEDAGMRALAAYFAKVVRSREIWRCAGTLSMFDREFIRFESLDCPFTDESGEGISHVIGMIFSTS